MRAASHRLAWRLCRPAIALSIALSLSCLLAPQKSAATARVFPVEIAPQSYSQWCWAAVSASAINTLAGGASVSQCEIAEWARERAPERLGDDNCCAMNDDPFTDAPCNRPNHSSQEPGSIEDILDGHGISVQRIPRALTPDEAIAFIDAGHLFIAYQAGFFVDGHFVLVHGYNDNTANSEDTRAPLLYNFNPADDKGAMLTPFARIAHSTADDRAPRQWTETLVLEEALPPEVALPASQWDATFEDAPDAPAIISPSAGCHLCAPPPPRRPHLLHLLLALF
ncbi:MAG: hypothetical protein GX146_05690 [Myxococcales bacterium]|nr:hypothetical protein [Myxococcales bacterium]